MIINALKQNKIFRTVFFPILIVRRILIRMRRAAYLFFFNRIFRVIDGGFITVRVPWFMGSFSMDAKSRTLIRISAYNEYEKNAARFAHEAMQKGGDGIDVGANIGFYTVLMGKSARRGNRVLSVEPIPANLKYLKINVAKNGLGKKVIIFDGAASNTKKSKKMINYCHGFEEHSRIGMIIHPEIRNKQSKIISVRQETIDFLVNKHALRPSLIKIDAEGADFLVLKGAQETIKKFRPVVICEFNSETQADYNVKGEQILDFFKENSYDVTFVEKEIILARPKEFR